MCYGGTVRLPLDRARPHRLPHAYTVGATLSQLLAQLLRPPLSIVGAAAIAMRHPAASIVTVWSATFAA